MIPEAKARRHCPSPLVGFALLICSGVGVVDSTGGGYGTVMGEAVVSMIVSTGYGIAIGAGGYLVGCICTGYYLVKWLTGQDIRFQGSGTVGARNVGRVAGKVPAIVAFVGDLAKGALVVLAAGFLPEAPSWAPAVAYIGVVLGHLYPCQLRFHGGKGVATMAGGWLVIDPIVVLGLAVVYGLMLLFWKKSKETGLIVVAFFPIVSLRCCSDPLLGPAAALVGMLVLLAHRKDIRAIADAARTRDEARELS